MKINRKWHVPYFRLRNALALHVPEIAGCPSLETLPRVIASTSLTEWLIVDEWRYTILGGDTLSCASVFGFELMRFARENPNNGMPTVKMYLSCDFDEDTVIFSSFSLPFMISSIQCWLQINRIFNYID